MDANHDDLDKIGQRSNGEYSETLLEIVSAKPGYLVQWGNLFFMILLIFIVSASWFIKYPEIVQAPAKLTSIHGPKPVVSYTSGKLIKLNVAEDQVVRRGQIIGFIESIGNHNSILTLAATLDSLKVILHTEVDIRNYAISPPDKLGELQMAYQTYLKGWLSYKNFIGNGFYLKKKKALVQDKLNLERLHENLEEEQALRDQDLELTEKTFVVNESLKRENVISELDFRVEYSKYINKKLSIPQIRSVILNNEILQAEKEKEILELDNLIEQQKVLFNEELNTLISRVSEWLRQYVLISPIDGRVAFESFVQENQQLTTNQVVCFVNPENSSYFAEIIVPQSNFGKVSTNQEVLLKFQSYPFPEYGPVIGKIEFINIVPVSSPENRTV